MKQSQSPVWNVSLVKYVMSSALRRECQQPSVCLHLSRVTTGLDYTTNEYILVLCNTYSYFYLSQVTPHVSEPLCEPCSVWPNVVSGPQKSEISVPKKLSPWNYRICPNVDGTPIIYQTSQNLKRFHFLHFVENEKVSWSYQKSKYDYRVTQILECLKCGHYRKGWWRVGWMSHDFSKKRGWAERGVVGLEGSNVRQVLLDTRDHPGNYVITQLYQLTCSAQPSLTSRN